MASRVDSWWRWVAVGVLGGRQVLGDDSRLVGWWLDRAGLGQSEPHSPTADVLLLVDDRRAYMALARAPHFNAQAHCLIVVDKLRHLIFYFLTREVSAIFPGSLNKPSRHLCSVLAL